MSQLLRRLEYLHDNEFHEPIEVKRKAGVSVKDVRPTAYARFLKRMAMLQAEYDQWATIIVDSVTSMEMVARRWDQFVLNPGAEDARQWYGASKDLLERMLIGRMGQLPMNVVVCAHIDDDKYEHQGKQRRMPMAPGKLRASLPSQYQEVYRAIADDAGYSLQTVSDGLWACTTGIDAPNGTVPSYHALWNGAKLPHLPLHVLVYGDFGSGKSTFAATFPKPQLVFCFDAYGKEMPYLKGGEVSDLFSDDLADFARTVTKAK